MGSSGRSVFVVAFVAALFAATVAPSTDAAARPRPELTGCKGECKRSENKCGGACMKSHAGCAAQCGCTSGHHCTEAQKNCFGLCNVRMEACVGGCRSVFTRCAAKC